MDPGNITQYWFSSVDKNTCRKRQTYDASVVKEKLPLRRED